MHIRSLPGVLLMLSILLTSCKFNCSVGDVGEEKDEVNKPVEKDGTLLYNGIKLEANGVKVKKAYLVANDDSGERVPQGNFVDVKKGVKLILLVDNGWKVTDDRVWLGASLKVIEEGGEKLLDKPDLFQPFDESGISAEDSKTLALSVFFSKWEAKRPVSMDVHFRVWDKKSDAFVEGTYTIHSK